MKIDLTDVKRMRYLDYRMNNDPKYMQKYSGKKYPRLVDYLFALKFGHRNLTPRQIEATKTALYRFLFKEGLFHSCQA